jgi:hypothetical protein
MMHLRKLLREGAGRPSPAAVAERLRKDLPAVVEKQAWMTTVYGDLVYPQAEGHRPTDFRFVTWYTRCIAELASTDLEARKAYQRALILQDGMYSMFRPTRRGVHSFRASAPRSYWADAACHLRCAEGRAGRERPVATGKESR